MILEFESLRAGGRCGGEGKLNEWALWGRFVSNGTRTRTERIIALSDESCVSNLEVLSMPEEQSKVGDLLYPMYRRL